MQLITMLSVLAVYLDMAGAADLRTEKNVFVQGQIGEAHGTPFDDYEAVDGGHGLHRRIASIAFACATGEHVYAFEMHYRDNLNDKNPTSIVRHGPMPPVGHPDYFNYDLGKDEYIIAMDWHTWRAKVGISRRTRIGFWAIRTNKAQGHLSCGVFGSKDSGLHQEPGDGALLYLSGSSGDAIDAVTPHWIPKADF